MVVAYFSNNVTHGELLAACSFNLINDSEHSSLFSTYNKTVFRCHRDGRMERGTTQLFYRDFRILGYRYLSFFFLLDKKLFSVFFSTGD